MNKSKKFLFLGLITFNNDLNSSILSREEVSLEKNPFQKICEKFSSAYKNFINKLGELSWTVKNVDKTQIECFYNPKDTNKLEKRKVFVTSHSKEIINNNDIVIDNLNILNGENGANTIYMNGEFFKKNDVLNLFKIGEKSHISKCSHMINDKEGKKQEINIIVISEPKTNKINLVLICTENIINNIDDIKTFVRHHYKIKDSNLVYVVVKKGNYFNENILKNLCGNYQEYKTYINFNVDLYNTYTLRNRDIKLKMKQDYTLEKNPSKELFSTFKIKTEEIKEVKSEETVSLIKYETELDNYFNENI